MSQELMLDGWMAIPNVLSLSKTNKFIEPKDNSDLHSERNCTCLHTLTSTTHFTVQLGINQFLYHTTNLGVLHTITL